MDIFQGILSEDPGGQSCFHNDIEIPFAFSIMLTFALLGKNKGGQSAVILAWFGLVEPNCTNWYGILQHHALAVKENYEFCVRCPGQRGTNC